MHASRGKWKPARHLLHLNRAIIDAVTGRGPDRILVAMPARHGKSEFLSKYVPTWYLGTFPDNRVIISSHTDKFAKKWGRACRNLLDEFGELFGVRVAQDSSSAADWDIEGRSGGMLSVGVGGSVTGRGANLLIVDDPIKSAEQADSSIYRERIWDWWQGTVSTRLEPGGIAIIIHTRWHHDDLIGRLLIEGGWHLINFPAIAEEEDCLGRKPGEPLWPERYDLDALERIKKTIGLRWWNAQFQQRPTSKEGQLFNRAWWKIVDAAPAGEVRAVRYWDKAGTADGGCYTAGALIVARGTAAAAELFVVDVVRGQWGATDREKVILTTAIADRERYPACVQWVEQEPGSGGKESAERTIKLLAAAGCPARADRVTGRKELRWEPWAALVGAGNVSLVAGRWNRDFIDEHCEAPHGAYRDQIDAAAGAAAQLTGRKTVDLREWLDVI